MEDYIKNYDNYSEKIIYDFRMGFGGIGDCIHFFLITLQHCIKQKYKLYYLINDIPIEKYLKLKYNKMYISKNEITQNKIIQITNIKDIENITNTQYNMICPNLYYCGNVESIFKNITPKDIYMKIEDIFYFSDEIIENSYKLLHNKIDNYISIHLRLGDKYLETNKSFILCLGDTRQYNEDKICNFIESEKDTNIIFFSDNNKYKLKLKEKYNNIIILNSEIGHTSLTNTTEKQTLDTITEFYIMTKSQKIYAASRSHFSVIASKFKNIPLINLY